MIRKALIFTVCLASLPLLARPWTNSSGKTIEAEFKSLDGDVVVLEMKGKQYRVPLSSLSEEDQEFARNAAKDTEKDSAEAPSSEPSNPGEWKINETAISTGKISQVTLKLSPENAEFAEKGNKRWRKKVAEENPNPWLAKMHDGKAITECTMQIGLPDGFDPSKPTPIFIVYVSADVKTHNQYSKAYWNSCKTNNTILLSVDSIPDTLAGFNTPNMMAMTKECLQTLEKTWPGAKTWPVMVGGFSGGAKYSQWMSALLSEDGYDVRGLFLGGCNGCFFEYAVDGLRVNKRTYRKIKCFMSAGKKDNLVNESHRNSVASAAKEADCKDTRLELYEGGHGLHKEHVTEAIKWFLIPEEK
ncbi:hypothetical protein SAMN02745181_3550 [Rubritalea squalenifaciens DSM 18772]|uniref:SLA1 homology domain-containing protein n=1 Tax=Rubritalea squalenifaciens DSM 18772 TaxID=1123071 RepID=A0A1M6R5C3_9BACT|nr:hypothetical protein [Rubritalea squalenifaciens]SHK27654.1 hypothetical protein SAMN02745181_3550 [Rubritalea squalenifaciens DSM 18772]